MKKILIVLIGVLISFSSYCQGDIIIKSFYDNGKIKEILSFSSNEILHGICLTYSQEGINTGLASYKHGVKHGEWKIWRENGSIVYEMYYKNGEKVGIWKEYDESNNIIQKRDFN